MYSLQYKPGQANGNADGLSRLPRPADDPELEPPTPAEVVLSIDVLNSSPETVAKVSKWTSRDPVLSLVHKFVVEGWPQNVPDDLHNYWRRRDEFSVQAGCVLVGSRVVIPAPGRESLLQQLHDGHPGITKMKALARSYFWWPSLDTEIEHTVRSCSSCQEAQKSPNPSSVHTLEWPGQPWSRVHMDYAGPIGGKILLILVDSHSKYIEAHVKSGATSAITIRKLHQSFASLGLPSCLVTDNGPAFSSSELAAYCQSNGIKHTRVSPYHPASNGLAEKAVQTVKSGICKLASDDLESRLHKFLFMYRRTPHSTTGQTPFQLLWSQRKPRSCLDLVFPDIGAHV